MSENIDLIKGIKEIENGNFDSALVYAKKVQVEFPDSADGFHLQGLVEQFLLKWNDSILSFSLAIKQSPYNPDLYNFRGYGYMNIGEMDEAESDFKEAIELEDFEPAHRNFVLWLILSDRSDEAVDYLTTRIQTKPTDIENFLLMGDLMKNVGRDDIAQSYFDKVEELRNN